MNDEGYDTLSYSIDAPHSQNAAAAAPRRTIHKKDSLLFLSFSSIDLPFTRQTTPSSLIAVKARPAFIHPSVPAPRFALLRFAPMTTIVCNTCSTTHQHPLNDRSLRVRISRSPPIHQVKLNFPNTIDAAILFGKLSLTW